MERSRNRGADEFRIRSTCGNWRIRVSKRGVRKIVLPKTTPSRKGAFEWELTPGIRGDKAALVRRLMKQIAQYFSGERMLVTAPLDLRGATRFRKGVWFKLRKIPFGGKKTYAELARLAGSPRAYRVVGGACAANPLPIIFPCHRVVGKKGLGGFSAGRRWKKFLLELERANS